MDKYWFELITGPMSCGKSEELIRRIRRAIIAKKQVKIFSPELDTREGKDIIKSRNGLFLSAIKIKNPIDILQYVGPEDDIIAIDELQFFDEEITDVIRQLIMSGKKVIGCGLEKDFKGDAFGQMPQLLTLANQVDKLTAICMKCGNEYATCTQRLINGQPVSRREPQITIEGKDKNETYEARCLKCWEVLD